VCCVLCIYLFPSFLLLQMDFIKKGAKAAKKLKEKGASAGESIVDAAKNPFELKELDEIVANLLEDCDKAIDKHTEPLQKEQADAVERELFERLNNKYDEKAKKKLDRECEDEQDNIAVRKRILNRGLDARAGKIYSKFSTDVTALNEHAAATMIRAVQSMRDAEATITACTYERCDIHLTFCVGYNRAIYPCWLLLSTPNWTP
jgi:hypothetical protein